MQVTFLDLKRIDFTGQCLTQILKTGFEIIGMGDVAKLKLKHFGLGIAEEFRPGAIHLHKGPVS